MLFMIGCRTVHSDFNAIYFHNESNSEMRMFILNVSFVT